MTSDTTYKHTNALVNETSPYLLQHAHNPVHWEPWSEKALEKAKIEDKLVLISVGYSACHWCHVMEHESFEDEEVADYMNQHFVCIKVDREERPDVDQIYMAAVQMMTGQGGWPMNVFALPDGRPIFGGTYFPKTKWMDIMENLVKIKTENPEKVEEYAQQVTTGIKQQEQIIKVDQKSDWDASVLDDMVGKWQTSFDLKEGGPNRAPKFPLPNNIQFLLRYATLNNNSEVSDYVHLTLKKMAFGGIYDQIGGGFARYSVDADWKVPHFEKMLYDNGQLLSLYAEAYRASGNTLYKDVIEQTYNYLKHEMLGDHSQFYSALDADSEGEEGKFYVWTVDELKSILGDQYALAADYFNVNNKGFWEHKNYILLRDKTDEEIAEKFNLTLDELSDAIEAVRNVLLEERNKRIKPGLDDKSLTSWNALTSNGLIDAYRATADNRYLDLAKQNINFILETQKRGDGGLNHNYKNGISNINGYLEDYCFTIQALLNLYQADFNPQWLKEAKELTTYSIEHFYDEESGFFNFNSKLDAALISVPREVQDNVVPASNSEMAKNLYLLGMVLDNKTYKSMSAQMLSNVYNAMPSYGSGFSNWGQLALWQAYPYKEVIITGESAQEMHQGIYAQYVPNIYIMAAKKKSNLPLLEGKFLAGKGTIFICENKTCQLPVNSVEEAMKQLK